ncbi:MAG: penicillin acylase family protein, partial [Acidimicrobiia bacterium]
MARWVPTEGKAMMNIPRSVLRLILGKRLPLTTGDLAVSGIEAPVRIRRDAFGVAYIDAAGDIDAWYGLGFCHGQDRAFQLEALKRVVNGTLAELVGPDGLAIDRLSRRIGFAHSAAEQLEVLDDDVRAMGDAYARGVTEGATLGSVKPAHEFALLKTGPTRYMAADAIGMLKLMSFLLASNWDSELVRYKILTQDGPEALLALDPTYPDWLPATISPGEPAGSAIDALASDLERFSSVVGLGGGSNNWAISGSRTATGRPIVAN